MFNLSVTYSPIDSPFQQISLPSCAKSVSSHTLSANEANNFFFSARLAANSNSSASEGGVRRGSRRIAPGVGRGEISSGTSIVVGGPHS